MNEMFCDLTGYCKGTSCPRYYECHGLEKKEKKEEKKTLLNSKIEIQDLEKYSKIITKKALKVISCSGSIYALKLLENKDLDTLEDLYQEVTLQIVLDGYIITKNAFRVVRSFIYHNFEKTEVEIFADDTDKTNKIEKTIDDTCYISYLNNSNEEPKKASKIDLKKLYKVLSATEKKIFQYYFINNMKKIDIANMLDIKKQNITTYITRIKQKAVKCI